MAKEILVLTGSPRRGGNSDHLADAFIRGAESAGHKAGKFEAAFKDIHGCRGCSRGCNMCWSSGTDPCVVKDDFYQLVPLIESCETADLSVPYTSGALAPSLNAPGIVFTLTAGEMGKNASALGKAPSSLAWGTPMTPPTGMPRGLTRILSSIWAGPIGAWWLPKG
jgi:hypothetical protein